MKVDGPIATAETILEEPAENSVLSSLMTTGKAGVDRVMRSNREPYMAADKSKVRTVVGAMRIGNLFFAAVPGESFPETQIGDRGARRPRKDTTSSPSPTISSATIRRPTRWAWSSS